MQDNNVLRQLRSWELALVSMFGPECAKGFATHESLVDGTHRHAINAIMPALLDVTQRVNATVTAVEPGFSAASDSPSAATWETLARQACADLIGPLIKGTDVKLYKRKVMDILQRHASGLLEEDKIAYVERKVRHDPTIAREVDACPGCRDASTAEEYLDAVSILFQPRVLGFSEKICFTNQKEKQTAVQYLDEVNQIRAEMWMGPSIPADLVCDIIYNMRQEYGEEVQKQFLDHCDKAPQGQNAISWVSLVRWAQLADDLNAKMRLKLRTWY
jgi:hypothetical protein